MLPAFTYDSADFRNHDNDGNVVARQQDWKSAFASFQSFRNVEILREKHCNEFCGSRVAEVHNIVECWSEREIFFYFNLTCNANSQSVINFTNLHL